MYTAVKRTRDDANGPAVEPVTVAEVKANSNIDTDLDDELINSLIIAATDYTEELTGRTLINRYVDFKMDAFPAHDELPIVLPYPPLISVISVKYYDDDDTLQTWDSAEYEIDTKPKYSGLLYPKRDFSYPSPRNWRDSVEIIYSAGYSDSGGNDPADRVPQALKQAILMLVGHLYENREASTMGPNFMISEAPLAFDAMISNYRVRRF